MKKYLSFCAMCAVVLISGCTTTATVKPTQFANLCSVTSHSDSNYKAIDIANSYARNSCEKQGYELKSITPACNYDKVAKEYVCQADFSCKKPNDSFQEDVTGLKCK